MGKMKLILVLSLVLVVLYLVSTFEQDEDLASVSANVTKVPDVIASQNTTTTPQPAEPAPVNLETAQQKVEQCRVSRAEIKDHEAANLAQLSEAIDGYLQQGNDWQILIPLFHHHDLNLELLDKAYIKFKGSSEVVNYLPDSLDQFLQQIIQSGADAANFSSFLLAQIEPDQINRRFSGAEELSAVQLEGANLATFTPAVLLIKSAAKQAPSEFIDDIRGIEFDGYAAAEALRTELPVQSMLQVLKQTPDLTLPVPLVDNFDSYPALNLADVAIENLNQAGLKWLENKGITPTNLIGWGAPLDRAMRPVMLDSDMSDGMKDKQIQMLNFLTAKGYAAHLSGDNYDEQQLNFFSALGHGVNININQNHNAHLLPLLKNMSFIRDNELPEPDIAAIPSAITALFANIEQLRTNSNEQYQGCKNADEDLVKSQQRYSQSEINQLIRRFAWDGESDGVLRELYNIDPELVRRATMRWANDVHDSGQYSRLLSLIRNKDKQAALDYVASTALDQYYTDQVLKWVLRDISLVPLWNARVSPLAPSHFWPFSRITPDKIQALDAAGFDLSLTDKIGQDIYSFAIFELSDELVEELIKLIPPANSAYGVDALDMLLDKIYLQDYVPAYTDKLLTYFPELEANHLARLARLKLFKPQIYQRMLLTHPRLAVTSQIKLNPVVYAKR